MSDDLGRPLAPLPAWTRPGLVVGIGLRASTSASDILALLDTCLETAHAARSDILGLVTRDTRADHPALASVSRLLAVPLITLPSERLERAVPNPSLRVAGHAGVASVAEAAALAFGPLVLAKQRSANVTCALSRYDAEGAARFSASSAASTLATSSAGP